MNLANKIFGKGQIKRKEWLRPVVVYKNDHITLKVLNKEKKSITELTHVMTPTCLPLSDPVQLMKGWRFPEAQRPVINRIRPRDIAFFHGMIDIKKLSFAEKLVVKGVKAPPGDFRDWDAITSWATAIVGALKK